MVGDDGRGSLGSTSDGRAMTGVATRVAWLDASGGISGDMLLGACLDAGVELHVVQAAIDGLRLPERVTLVPERVRRCGLAATLVRVTAGDSDRSRRLDDVLALLATADLDEDV